MDALWNKLIHIDARLTSSIIAILSTLVSIAAIVQIEWTQAAYEDLPRSTPDTSSPENTKPEFLGTSFETDFVVPNNPFRSAFLPKHLEILSEQTRWRQRAAKQTQPKVAITEPDIQPPAKPLTTYPQKTVRLIYHGLFTLPGKSLHAMIEDHDTRTTEYREQGQAYGIFEIGSFSRNELVLLINGKEAAHLPVNRVQEVVIPHES